MAVAEEKSWEYTLGRIDERTENIEKRLTRVETDVAELRSEMRGELSAMRGERSAMRGELSEMRGELSAVKEAMLTKGTFFTVLGMVSSIIVAFLVYIVSNLG